ncbi:DUF5710 domain-containing protein [Streptomyces xanthochromogenes]|uniref:DUF5710 domain-containing protein n=1 Tax=Streptomyces xanthochromogenes TaxID=67384 RepID=UPI003800BB33
MERIWLDVPFREKDQAKTLGARWDAVVQSWYAPHPGMTALHRWAVSPPSRDGAVGEDPAVQRARRDALRAAARRTPLRNPPKPRSAPKTKQPAAAEVFGYEQISAVLSSVLTPSAPGAYGGWITIPPWNWFCHMCDSNAHPPDIAVAQVRRARWGRTKIVCQPYEWWHDFQRLEVPQRLREAAEATAREVLSRPGSAAMWDAAQQRFDVITGNQVNWRGERGR